MADRPIIFSAPMVRALLDGRKTQTRRVLKPQPLWMPRDEIIAPGWAWRGFAAWQDGPEFRSLLAKRQAYAPGDRLYVREAHSLHSAHGQERNDGKRWGPWEGLPTAISPDGTQIAYYREAFDRCGHRRWRPSIHMPRWASRLTLTVTDVRVQRLQEISGSDAISEGLMKIATASLLAIEMGCDWGFHGDSRHGSPVSAFAALWDSIHGDGAWDANPWVCALTFTVQHGNIDQIGGAP